MEWAFDVARDARGEALAVSSPAVVASQGSGGERRRIYFGAGLDDFTRGILYCLEEEVRDRAGE